MQNGTSIAFSLIVVVAVIFGFNFGSICPNLSLQYSANSIRRYDVRSV